MNSESSDEENFDRKNILSTKNHLFTNKNNIVFFTPAVLHIKSDIIKTLIEKKYIDKDKFNSCAHNKNQILKFKKNKFQIFAIILKNTVSDFASENDMLICLNNLKNELLKYNIKNFRISRDPFILDEIVWRQFKENLKNVFKNTDICITICENIIAIPPAIQRKDIISEFYIFKVNDHENANSAYKN